MISTVPVGFGKCAATSRKEKTEFSAEVVAACAPAKHSAEINRKKSIAASVRLHAARSQLASTNHNTSLSITSSEGRCLRRAREKTCCCRAFMESPCASLPLVVKRDSRPQGRERSRQARGRGRERKGYVTSLKAGQTSRRANGDAPRGRTFSAASFLLHTSRNRDGVGRRPSHRRAAAN